ncbi:MAG: hypothetical protein FWH48_03620 [Oscillospiraceae bacterium]|nr:hypothetical protein [Oscillospiraceae bacterium]
MKNKGILWIAQTAIFVALLIGGQAATASFGQLVTGSWVNAMLIISVMTCGLASGLTVAALSPVFAKLFGIGPLWSIIFFIMAANAALVLTWHLIGNMKFANVHLVRILALCAAAICKFLVLYIGIVQLAVPFLLNLPEPQAAAVSALFSLPQLITASIGGAIAIAILPAIEKITTKS